MIKLFSKLHTYAWILALFVIANTAFADPFSAKDKFAFSSNTPGAPKKFGEMVCIIVKLALDIIPFIVVLAVGAFLMGLIKYISNGDNEEKRSEGSKMMIYGVVGFFFMVSVWGVVGLLTNSFGISVLIPQLGPKGSEFTCNSN